MCACAAARGSDSREGEAAHAEEGQKSPLRIAARAHDRRAEGGGEGAPTEDSGCARASARRACEVWSRAPELAGVTSRERHGSRGPTPHSLISGHPRYVASVR